jgi:hypothetical protein
MQTERRRRRSASPSEALGLYFESLAARYAWEAVALADDDGLLLGGAGKGVDQEGIAAIAPVAAREHEHPPEGLLGLVTRGRPPARLGRVARRAELPPRDGGWHRGAAGRGLLRARSHSGRPLRGHRLTEERDAVARVSGWRNRRRLRPTPAR